MRKSAIILISLVGLIFGTVVGLLATSISGFTPAIQQTSSEKTWPLIDVQEQVPISVTLSFGEDEAQPVVVPMILHYKFTASLAGRFSFQDIDVPSRATFADLVNINSLESIKYDNSGIGHVVSLSDNISVDYASFSGIGDSFTVKGTITNNDSDRVIKDADVVLTVYDTAGEFLGSVTNWNRIASDDPDELIFPGGGNSFIVGFDEKVAKFNDVGFYHLFVSVVFADAPQRRR